MSVYQVFVEGPATTGPSATAQLAEAIAGHYGLPAADIAARLATGRFRVKSNADLATANTYVADLTRLGARCTIVDAQGQAVAPSAIAPVDRAAAMRISTPVMPATPAAPPKAAALPPPNRAAAPASPTASRPPSAAAPQYASGLSAAFSGESSSADIGVLGSDAAFSLSSIDGAEDSEAGTAGGFAPPPEPATTATQSGAKSSAKSGAGAGPIDMFAPPEDNEEGQGLALAIDRPARPPQVEAPPAASSSLSMPAAEPGTRDMRPAAARSAADQANEANAAPRVSVGERVKGLLRNTRARFAAGVMIAILVGFIPAALIAGVREKGAFREVDVSIHAAQGRVSSMSEWQELDNLRAEFYAKKQTERRDIAISSFIIWAAVGGALAFVWFRKLDWDRLIGEA